VSGTVVELDMNAHYWFTDKVAKLKDETDLE
jgi:hypothetical protein